MDMDAFTQCLTYIQATSLKPSVDKYLPLVGTVVGAALAFGLNYFSTTRKETKTKGAKKDCCVEDIHELMNICKQTLEGLLELCEPLALKNRPTGHNLLPVVSLPLLEKYYPEIAHSFSVSQRYWIKLVFRYVGEINGNLHKLLAAEDETSLYRISIAVVNLESVVFETYKLCYCILGDQQFEFSEHYEALAELGIISDRINWLKMLSENTESGNKKLGLPNT
ncbi:hypothetical protein [Pseudomonas sp. LAIL14HWK12:I9]|uniref:hypothetical protein n=1 Tax=Pseudomonas sp. LAIL14HWK12:I9 TaxID=1259804 RepID=UPI000481209A|nr:hypothetical protein [Pseudomonas sp. LAIL14HWK12:I9]